MLSVIKEKKARKIYELLKQAATDENIAYEANDERLELELECRYSGGREYVIVGVRPELGIVRGMAVVPSDVKTGQEMEAIQACNLMNGRLRAGQFAYHPEYRRIVMTIGSPYSEAETTSEEWLQQILRHMADIINRYFGVLDRFSKGKMPIDELMDYL